MTKQSEYFLILQTKTETKAWISAYVVYVLKELRKEALHVPSAKMDGCIFAAGNRGPSKIGDEHNYNLSLR